MTNFYKFICVIIFVILNKLNAQTPPSPCPDIFNYRDSGSGIIRLFADPYVLEHSITVGLSVPIRLTGNYIGDISVGSANVGCGQMKRTGYLTYTINFPVTYPLITSIIYNQKTICSGRGFVGVPFVTNIRVSFDLKCLEGHMFTRQPNFNNPINTQFIQNQNFNNPINTQFIQNQDDDDVEWIPEFEPTVPTMVTNNRRIRPTPTVPVQQTTTDRPRNQPLPTTECGTTEFLRPLIVNGRPSQPGQFPWLAAIHHNRQKGFICGGNLITDKYILTAAHCITESGRNPREYVIYLGLYDLEKLDAPGVQKTVGEKLEVHTDYENLDKYSRADADIALIRIQRIKYTTNVRPICIPQTVTPLSELYGTEGIIAGWGMNENGTISSKIRQTGVIIASTDTCTTNIEFRTHMTDRTFCAGGLNRGPCTGDSGGGLFLSLSNIWYIRGLVSVSLGDFSRSGCDVTNYAIYVDITSFIDWITDIVS